jgi:hypothetical protein
MTAKEHLDKAAEIVSGDRQRDYGHPRENHGCTAALWTWYLHRRDQAGGGNVTIDAQDVCVLNILQKLSRYANRRTDDSITDVIGYALNMAMIAEPDSAATPHDAPKGCSDDCPHPGAVNECEWCANVNACCRANQPGALLICTREKGHTGDHVACGDGDHHAMARWPNTEQPAVDTPANSETAERETAEAHEWPKWGRDHLSAKCDQVRVYGENDAFCYDTEETPLQWVTTEIRIDACKKPITRADAVALIGEAAVAEGERLAGVGQPKIS